jgi:hypothetical protein
MIRVLSPMDEPPMIKELWNVFEHMHKGQRPVELTYACLAGRQTNRAPNTFSGRRKRSVLNAAR